MEQAAEGVLVTDSPPVPAPPTESSSEYRGLVQVWGRVKRKGYG